MSQKAPAPYPIGDLREWAIKLITYLNEEPIQEEVTARPMFLTHKRAGDKAVQAGVMLYDPQLGSPVYADGSQWNGLPGVQILNNGAGSTGNDNWRLTDDTLEMWGRNNTGGTGPYAITFPKTFANANGYSFLAMSENTAARILTVSGKATNGLTVNAFTTAGAAVSSFFMWYAIGKWDGTS